MTGRRFFPFRSRRGVRLAPPARSVLARLAQVSRAHVALLLVVALIWGSASVAGPLRLSAATRFPMLSHGAGSVSDARWRTPLMTRAGQPPVEESLAGRGGAAALPRISATAAVLMDARSGRVLYSLNPHLVWPPASTTKIMTALLAIETMPLGASISISRNVARFRDGSVVGLPEGARIPLHDLLYGLMLQSGNDVALAIAEGVAGTVDAFVGRMNDEARRLGATQTHFTSPHGLYEKDHYSTAYDLALITRVALQNPTFRDIVRTRRWTFVARGARPRMLWNHNRLLSWYPGADGVKTGYVHQSGPTLVASATRNGLHLIAVVLHSRNTWRDASRLLSYGFENYRSLELARTGEDIATVELPGSDQTVEGVVLDDIYGVLAPGEEAVPFMSLKPRLALPIRRGDQIGELKFYASGRLVGAGPLVAAHGVDSPPGMVDRMMEWVGRIVRQLSSAVVL
jgi:D-alanyl-D-alanine carboxypeptidase (penicillin-binding protein 5/6)